MCSATVMNSIVGKALQLSVYSDTTEHAQNLAFALKSLPDLFKPNGKCTVKLCLKWSHMQPNHKLTAVSLLPDIRISELKAVRADRTTFKRRGNKRSGITIDTRQLLDCKEVFTLKIHQMFSVHTTAEELNAPITTHFGFVFEEITWLSWRRGVFKMFSVHTRTKLSTK